MKRIILSLIAGFAVFACSQPKVQEFSVIPEPVSREIGTGVFNVAGAAVNCGADMDSLSLAAVDRFVWALETVSGKPCKAKSARVMEFSVNPELEPEQYRIEIGQKKLSVEASALNGFVYAIETIKQMLPPAIYGLEKTKASWVLPCGRIEDSPRFAYRGVMLDPCRHFWSVEETKKLLDVMAAYKINRMHWHLTDDQGWRMEIKSLPLLTQVGAWRDGTMIAKDFDSSDGIRYGGYYTQEELREVVAYAAARGITVVPEVDLPGHMIAALASYPELGCTGGPYEVRQKWGIALDILCAGNEKVFDFLGKVFDELVDIFPSQYVHIGGDECFGGRRYKGSVPWDSCPKCKARMRSLGIRKGPQARHYLQNYVTSRVQQMLQERGKKVIGWDEILQGELAPGATVMSWRGIDGGVKAVGKGMDVIMSPNSYMYIDHYQSEDRDNEPLAIGGFLPLEKVYGYEPTEGMPEGAQERILGVQCNLWTEYIATPEYLEYMLLPRMCAAAEVQWCPQGSKDFERFNSALNHSYAIFDAMGVNYRKPVKEE